MGTRVVLRLGRFVGLRGPGLFWIVPFIDSVASRIDQRRNARRRHPRRVTAQTLALGISTLWHSERTL
jgi:regulator of protease activity HflC (stomatin/prohibitin superfamily)